MKKTSVVIVFILISFNLVFGFFSLKKSKKCGVVIAFLENEIKRTMSKTDKMLMKNDYQFDVSLKFDNTKINKKIGVFKSKNDLLFLEDVINSKTKLIYRISDNVCSICYDQVIKEINNYSTEIGRKNIIILVPIERINELGSYLAEINCQVPFYGIKKGALGLEVDKSSPFFFCLDTDMKANHVFIPSKSESESLKKYFDLLENRYF